MPTTVADASSIYSQGSQERAKKKALKYRISSKPPPRPLFKFSMFLSECFFEVGRFSTDFT